MYLSILHFTGHYYTVIMIISDLGSYGMHGIFFYDFRYTLFFNDKTQMYICPKYNLKNQRIKKLT